jgi:hypothetical protein
MDARLKRLGKLIAVQNRLKAHHELRQAAFAREASAAQREAEQLMVCKSDPGSLFAVFPQVYDRGIEKALELRERRLAEARLEAAKVAAEIARCKLLERAYRLALRETERRESEKQALEQLERPRRRSPQA